MNGIRHRATVRSVNVGLPADVEWRGRTVHTGIWKRPVTGPVMARRLNLDGDGQGDLAGHGGEQRALLVYQLDSYRHWARHFGRDLEPGSFGENLTVDGLPDDEVCIGDRYRIGGAEVEVTQPRVTCFRVGLRLAAPDLPALLVAHRRPGFYLRVVGEGPVHAGDPIELVRRGPHALSVAEADALLYLPDPDLNRLHDAVDIPALSPGWQQSFRDLVAAHDRGAEPAPARAGVEPGWRGWRALTVAAVVAESPDVLSVHLRAADGAPLPRPQAGQFLTVRLADGTSSPPVRTYSLSAAPGGATYRISVKRVDRGRASGWIHDHLAAGAVVEAAAPRGDFRLDPDSTDPVVLVSAGIGITPVLAMLYELADTDPARAVWWLHTSRDAAHHAFAAEAREVLARLPNAHARTYYTGGGAGGPDTAAGRLTAQVLAGLGIPASSRVHICGPAGFMTAMGAAFAQLGVAPAQIHSEAFGALAPLNPGVVAAAHVPPHVPDEAPGTGPSVTFARSGLTVAWAEDRYGSLLELAETCDVPTRWSCRSGVCHTCVTPVLSGAVRYTAPPLLAPASDEVLLCCARPASDVVLDL